MNALSMAKHGFKVVKNFAVSHSPIICTGLALIGVGATVIATVKATKKTGELIKKAEQEKGTALTKKEVVRTTWKAVVPAVIAVIVTCAAIVTAQYQASKTIKSMAALYSATLAARDSAIENIIDATTTKFGPECEEVVEKALDKTTTERVDTILKHQGELLETGTGGENDIWLDMFSGRKFRASKAHVDRAILEFQREYTNKGMIRINRLYDYLRIPKIQAGHYAGYIDSENNYHYVPEVFVDAACNSEGDTYKYIDFTPSEWFMDDNYGLPWR